MRSLVRVCMKAVTSTAKCSDLPQVASYSSPERRPVPAMRMWIYRQSFGCASDPNFINSWVAGALDSAWRAVDQYLLLNQPESVREKFWKLWGPTEYWDEASNKELVDLNHDLTERHLVISLHKAGYTQRMPLIHKVPFSPQETENYRQLVFNDLTFGLRHVLEAMKDMGLEVADDNAKFLEVMAEVSDLPDGEPFPVHCLEPLKAIWADINVQKACSRGNEAALPEK